MNNDVNSNPGTLNENKGMKYNERVTKKESSAKWVLITAIISFVVLVIAGAIGYSLFKTDHDKQLSLMEAQKNSYANQLTTRDSVIDQWVSTFDEIEKNLATIKEKEKVISMNSSGAELSKDKKTQVLEDIKDINKLLEQNKQKIASLNAQLKKSGGSIKALESKIAELEASMKKSEDEIAVLKTSLTEKTFQIEQLDSKVADMQTTIIQKDEKINNQTGEMNKAFVASGTYKELKAKGLVTKEGGFIGLGRKEALLENFPDSSFKQVNITELKTIPVDSKNVKLITEHPTNSYELVRDGNKKVEYIEIKDPDEFWKISKFAVVEVGR